MRWFHDMAKDERFDPSLRDIVIALAEMEKVMALDLSKLQSDVAAQGDLIGKVQSRVAALEAGQGSSADQAAVDALASQVESNNATLTTLASS